MRLLGSFNYFQILCRFTLFALVTIFLSGCTVINKSTFEILPPDSVKRDEVLLGIEAYFKEIGIPLERKTDILYPKKTKTTRYLLGNYKSPTLLYSSYNYLVLRLEAKDILYIDWIKISDLHEKPKPSEFENTHKKIAEDLMIRIGVTVKFNYVPDLVGRIS
jgi:hypothetical protein